MRASQAVREVQQRLAAAGTPSPQAEARTLVAHVLDVEPNRLLVAPDLDDLTRERLEELVAQRCAGRPVQHLTGEAWFRTVRLAVGPGVFVPRPETEVMTGWALERLAELPTDAVVVELCAGSGAISLAIATERPGCRQYAVELSDDALVWAERNLSHTDVTLVAGDMADALPELDGTVDLIICNPPYIPLTAWEQVAEDVREHDPHLALFSGDDGLDAMRVLAKRGLELLKPGGWLCAEHAEVQARSAPEVFVVHGGWGSVRDHVDLNDRPRFVTARAL